MAGSYAISVLHIDISTEYYKASYHGQIISLKQIPNTALAFTDSDAYIEINCRNERVDVIAEMVAI